MDLEQSRRMAWNYLNVIPSPGEAGRNSTMKSIYRHASLSIAIPRRSFKTSSGEVRERLTLFEHIRVRTRLQDTISVN